MATDSRFDKRTLRERCTQHVRDEIISGQIRPGEHLVEMRLADELGVSRGTLREALRPLELEGLIVDDGKRHMRVRELSSQEILDVFEVRAGLEVLAVRRIVQSGRTASVAAELRAALEPLKDAHLEFGQQLELDLKFHERLCALSGNPTLLASWQNLIGQIEMMIIAAGPERAGSRMRFQEHIVIVEALESGDAEHAASVLAHHMQDFSGRYVRDAIDREKQSEAV